ncbi:MAG: PEGA domain-containing protein, partial [Pseudomonadota bacterium]
MRGMKPGAAIVMAAVFLLWGLFAGPAFGQKKKGGAGDEASKEAKQRFARGVEFFNNGEYAAALAEFHWAYEVSPHYMVLFNIGRCYAKIGKHIEAIDYFQEYLKEAGDNIPGKRKEEVRKELDALIKIIAYLDVEVNVKGAEIMIAGKVAGTYPLEGKIKVEPGPHTVSVSAEGYKSTSKDIVVAGGATMTVDFELEEIVKWAKLIVASDVPGAVIVVDGKEKGKAPWEGMVKAGKVSVYIKARGYGKDVKEVVLEADEERLLTLNPPVTGKPAKLKIKANVEGAEVFIEGKKSGVIPIKALELPAGVVRVKVMAEGYAAWEGDLELAEGKPVTADVKLKSDRHKIHKAYFWGFFALGLAAAVAAGTTGYLALDKQDEYDGFLQGFEDGSIADNAANRKKFDDLADEGESLVLATDILWVATGTFAATAFVLAFVTKFKPPESRVKVSLGPGVNGAAPFISCSG